MAARACAWLAIALQGCGGESSPAPALGVADDGCPAGTLGLPDGSCQPAGIPPDQCGAGFVPSGDGCEPILPAEACPPGLMAVPGESDCREVMPCGAGTWGDIPVDDATEYVDQAYAGGGSDGSSAKPWTSIGQAIAAAAPGALVAIAAGSYAEDVLVQGKSVRLWGVCPGKVELVGSASAIGALDVRASGTEAHGLAIRGGAIGVAVSGATGVMLDRLWVHDAVDRGIGAQETLGPTSLAIQGSLVEQNHEFGLFVSGSEALIDATVVRGTLPQASDQAFGRGIEIQAYAATGTPSSATVHASLVEQNHELGVGVFGSEALIEATVVRGTLPQASDQTSGRGIAIQAHPATGTPASATVRASMIEQNHEIGLFVAGAGALIEATVVRGTLPGASDQHFGRGINIQLDTETGAPASVTVRVSVVDQNQDVGVFVDGSVATLEDVVVRNTAPRQADGFFGDGVTVASHFGPATASLTRCTVSDNARAGLSNFGGFATILDSVLACNGFDLEGETYPELPFAFDNEGGNVCGCPAGAEACGVESTGLAPPEPLEPSE